MIPYPSRTLTDIALRIATHLMPDLQTEYGQADAGLLTGLLLTFAQEYEREVYHRLIVIVEIQALFETRTDKLSDGDAPDIEAIRAFTRAAPASLKLDDVTACHAEGFNLLIELHAWAEQHDAELELEIWRLLRRHSERNKFDMPGP